MDRSARTLTGEASVSGYVLRVWLHPTLNANATLSLIMKVILTSLILPAGLVWTVYVGLASKEYQRGG
jgi:hypothetical protein